MNAITIAEIHAGKIVAQMELPDLLAMQKERAKTLWAEKMTASAIARTIGVAPSTLRRWIGRDRQAFPFRRGDGAPPRPDIPDSPELFEAARLWGEGMTKGRIALALGLKLWVVEGFVIGRRELFPVRRPVAGLPAEKPVQALSPPAPPRADYVAGLDALARPEPARGGPIPLVALRETTCKWPVTGALEHTLFCGARSLAGKPYCRAHARLAYQPKTETREGTAR